MKKLVIFLVVIVAVLTSPTIVSAEKLQERIKNQVVAGADRAGFDRSAGASPREIILDIIQIMLTFVGIILILLILFSGYLLITARGDDAKVEKATTNLRGAVIGFIIIILSYSITIAIGKYSQSSQKYESKLTELKSDEHVLGGARREVTETKTWQRLFGTNWFTD